MSADNVENGLYCVVSEDGQIMEHNCKDIGEAYNYAKKLQQETGQPYYIWKTSLVAEIG